MQILKLLLAIAVVCTATVSFAQAPANDDCATAIPLPVLDCQTTVYTNVNATTSVIGTDNVPDCFTNNVVGNDVWFSFVCPDTLLNLRLTLTGTGSPNGIDNPEIAIYRGSCGFDLLAEYLCIKADPGETEIVLDMIGLTPGLTYYVRVAAFNPVGTGNDGEFTLCVDKIPPVVTIDQGSSTLCEGKITDTGGLNDDYGPDENNVFVICPSAQTSCIEFVLEYYNLDYAGPNGTGSDVLTLYAGNNTSAPVLASINGAGFSQEDIAGGGGVCFKTYSNTSCLTIEFTSDGVVENEGFLGSWKCSSQSCPQSQDLIVEGNITNQTIVNSVATPATTVTVTDILCNQDSYGTFSLPTANNDLAMAKGLLLTSGSAFETAGPGSFFASNIMGEPGDADLDYLSEQQNGEESNDACVIELDVFVATDELTFEYVFGSEEYPEFVNSPGGYNDIFAFLVSGPGITGDPGLNGQKNIAVLPGTSTPVEINSVNNGLNWQYYRNNELGQEVTYDGLTADFLGIKKTLTARTPVIPCNTYHLKLAVADRGDASYDSGVFISEIKGGTPDLKVQFASGIDYFIESCSGSADQLVISLSEPLEEAASFITSVSGTATLGQDYTLSLPGVITFLPGQTELTFPIMPLDDTQQEGTETILITLSNDFGCGTVVYKTITIEIKDNVDVDINLGADTLLVCAGTTFQLEASGATTYFWQPPNAVSNPNIPNPTITPTSNLWVRVTGSIATCVDVDSVYIQIVDPMIEIQPVSDSTICQGTSVNLVAVNNVNNQGLQWDPMIGLSDPNSNQPVATPASTTTYTVSVEVSGCKVSDQVTIYVDTLFFPIINTLDTNICQNFSVDLGSDIENSTTTFAWTPAAGLSDPAASGPIATPDVSTTYTLVATSANGYCSQTASVVVDVTPADVFIEGDKYREICLGSATPLVANASPAGGTVKWTPPFYVSTPTGPTTIATPDESVTIKATYTINGCTVVDSVRIRVDSLPDLTIGLRPLKPIYCPGDTVTLLSTTYEPANFPDIRHLWLNGPGQITPDSFFNMVIRADSSFLYQRITQNRACLDTAGVFVPVGKIPDLVVTVDKDKICPGESVQLSVVVTPPQAIEWDAGTAPISCTECLNPTSSPFVSATYTVKTPDADCPASASIEVEVVAPPGLNLASSGNVCAGTPVLLNNMPADPTVTYTWTSVPAGFTSSETNPSVTPTQTTTYNVTATNAENCQSTGTITLTPVDATLTASNDITICKGATATLTATATGTTDGFYQWVGNANTQTITVNPDATTVYQVVYTYGPGCTETESVTVTIDGELVPLSVPTDAGICPGGSITLNNAPITPGATYVWTATPADNTLNASAGAPTVSPTQNTVYNVTATNGLCVSTATVSVTAFKATLTISNDITICAGSSATLTATGSLPGSYAWSNTETTPTITVTPDANTTYNVVYVYGANCVLTESVDVSVKPAVQLLGLVANPSTFPVCSGETVTLKANVFGGGNNVFTWKENGVDLAGNRDSIVVRPVTASKDPQSIVYSVSVTSGNGCADGPKEITITVKRCFEIPNAFTPNGDDLNNVFEVVTLGGTVDITNFEIYNRWGQRIFRSEAPNASWDGKVDGSDAPIDVYIYKITVKNPDNTTETYTGEVNLIR